MSLEGSMHPPQPWAIPVWVRYRTVSTSFVGGSIVRASAVLGPWVALTIFSDQGRYRVTVEIRIRELLVLPYPVERDWDYGRIAAERRKYATPIKGRD